MLAEIFLVRLQMMLHMAATNSAATKSDPRFTPVALPKTKDSDRRGS